MKMKRILALIIAVLMCVSLMVSCGGSSDGEGEALIVVGTEKPTVYTVDLSKIEITNGLLSVLDYMQENENLEYTENSGMLKSVGALSEDTGKGIYLYIYTSVEKDFDVSEWKQTMEYKGKTLTSSGVGAADMTIEDGAVIYIGTIVYG